MSVLSVVKELLSGVDQHLSVQPLLTMQSPYLMVIEEQLSVIMDSKHSGLIILLSFSYQVVL
jgi:hypothetical protein